jgi:hypothetical protein
MRDGPAALETGLVGPLLGGVCEGLCGLGKHIWGAAWDARRVSGSWEEP